MSGGGGRPVRGIGDFRPPDDVLQTSPKAVPARGEERVRSPASLPTERRPAAPPDAPSAPGASPASAATGTRESPPAVEIAPSGAVSRAATRPSGLTGTGTEAETGRRQRAPAPVPPPAAPAPNPGDPKTEQASTRRPGIARRYEGKVQRTTIALPAAVDDALIELVHERRHDEEPPNKNDLMLAGIERLLVEEGRGTIEELVRSYRPRKRR